MYTNRFFSLLVTIFLLAVTVLVVQRANATAFLGDNVDSATRSYTAYAAWAKAKAAEAEASTVDSATRSYIAQAKAVACGMEAFYGLDLDSATRSYIAWGFALQAKNDLGALCR
ncbi:MAG TPA: hypothetical protein VK900_19500 [Anaerolineales bacterium]|nr:hypothetical protein [Anaerolineales bacterium]